MSALSDQEKRGVFFRDDGKTLLTVKLVGGHVMIHERPCADPDPAKAIGGIWSLEEWKKMTASVEHQEAHPE